MKKSPRSRVMAALAGAILGLTAFASPAGATDDSKLFTHTFEIKDGKATATVTPNRDLDVAEEVTLVSYFAPQPQFSTPQYAFQHQTGTLKDKDGVVTLTVEVPDCNTQVDLFFGGKDDVIEVLDGDRRYGNKKLGEKGNPGARSKGPAGWFNGGNKACVQPVVQPVPQCDGSVDLQLSNNGKLSKYDVQFRVKATGFDQTVKVPAGKGETVKIPAGAGTITVSAPHMQDFTYAWVRPENCLPAVAGENDCTNVTVTVTNPEGNAPAKAEVTYGSETKTTTVAPGTSQLVTFPAGEATTATVSYPEITGTKPVTIPVKKGECSTKSPSPSPSKTVSESPSPSPSESPSKSPSAPGETPEEPVPSTPGDEDPELALTGAAAGSVAGGAALLLIVGAGLFFMARRRKLNFKA